MVEDGNKGPWRKSVATQRLKYVSSISGNTRKFPPSCLFPIKHSLRNKYNEVQHFESDSLVYTNWVLLMLRGLNLNAISSKDTFFFMIGLLSWHSYANTYRSYNITFQPLSHSYWRLPTQWAMLLTIFANQITCNLEKLSGSWATPSLVSNSLPIEIKFLSSFLPQLL